jgi:hypothetical protein
VVTVVVVRVVDVVDVEVVVEVVVVTVVVVVCEVVAVVVIVAVMSAKVVNCVVVTETMDWVATQEHACDTNEGRKLFKSIIRQYYNEIDTSRDCNGALSEFAAWKNGWGWI